MTTVIEITKDLKINLTNYDGDNFVNEIKDLEINESTLSKATVKNNELTIYVSCKPAEIMNNKEFKNFVCKNLKNKNLQFVTINDYKTCIQFYYFWLDKDNHIYYSA